jgi:hypothetical protein
MVNHTFIKYIHTQYLAVCVDSVVRLCKEKMHKETHQGKHKELARLLQSGEPIDPANSFWVSMHALCVCMCVCVICDCYNVGSP